MSRPVALSSYWDAKRNAVTHKVAIPGTSRYLLFTDESLRDLQRQIEAATQGTEHDRAT